MTTPIQIFLVTNFLIALISTFTKKGRYILGVFCGIDQYKVSEFNTKQFFEPLRSLATGIIAFTLVGTAQTAKIPNTTFFKEAFFKTSEVSPAFNNASTIALYIVLAVLSMHIFVSCLQFLIVTLLTFGTILKLLIPTMPNFLNTLIRHPIVIVVIVNILMFFSLLTILNIIAGVSDKLRQLPILTG